MTFRLQTWSYVVRRDPMQKSYPKTVRGHEVPNPRDPESKREVVGHMQKSEGVPGEHIAPNQNFSVPRPLVWTRDLVGGYLLRHLAPKGSLNDYPAIATIVAVFTAIATLNTETQRLCRSVYSRWFG